MRVLIADDQELLRKSLGQLLDYNDDIEVIKLVEDGEKAVEYVRKLKPDIAILDIEMPNMNGISALRIIKEEMLKTKVVMLTTFDTRENITGAFLAGADGYVGKEVAPDELILALKCVMTGMTVISNSVKKLMIEQLDSVVSAQNLMEELGKENIAIIRAVVDGKANKIIAEELGFSEGTVKNKISKLYEQLGIEDRLGLAVFAMENGIA